MDQAFASGDTFFACQNASNIAAIMNLLTYDEPDMYDVQLSTEGEKRCEHCDLRSITA